MAGSNMRAIQLLSVNMRGALPSFAALPGSEGFTRKAGEWTPVCQHANGQGQSNNQLDRGGALAFNLHVYKVVGLLLCKHDSKLKS